jgi:nitrogen-specific signal transduction histidine kinase
MSEDSANEASGEVGALATHRGEAARGPLQDALKQLQRRLLEAEGREQAAQVASAGIAHDLRNLLTVISGHVDLALDHPAVDAELRDDLQGIARASEQAKGIVALLAGSDSNWVLPAAPLALEQSITTTCELLSGTLGRGFELQVSLRPTEPIWVHAVQFERILTNLLLNARDAMPGGGLITIETDDITVPPGSAQRAAPGRYAILRVRDTGGGMSPEVRARLFQPSFTTKEQGKGTGLGLTTIASLVAWYGGAIDVQSAPGAGSTFEVYFRVEPPGVARRAAVAQQQQPVANPASAGVTAQAPIGSSTLQILRAEAGHVAIGWVAAGVLFASFHGHLSCALSDAYVAHLPRLLAGSAGARYFVDSSALDSFDLAARTATIRSLATVSANISSVLVLKWSGDESPSGLAILKDLVSLVRTTADRREFDAALRAAASRASGGG